MFEHLNSDSGVQVQCMNVISVVQGTDELFAGGIARHRRKEIPLICILISV